MGHGQHDRAVPLRRQHRLRRRRRAPPRRHAPVPLRDDRPRQDVEAARRRARAERLPARRARGSEEARAAVPRHRARRDVLARPLAELEAAAAEPADRGGPRSRRQGRQPRRRHARAVALDPGRPRPDPRVHRPDRRRAAASVRAGAGDAVALRIEQLGHARHLLESAARRGDLLRAEGRREGRAEDRDPGQRESRGADAEQHGARADGQRRQRGPRRFQERGARPRRRHPARGVGPALRRGPQDQERPHRHRRSDRTDRACRPAPTP